MAKYYNYTGNNLLNVQLALNNYFTNGVNYYGTPSSTQLIFSHANISDLVIRLFDMGYGIIGCQLGTWSGSAFTKTLIDFAGTYTNSNGYSTDSISLIIKEDGIAIFLPDSFSDRVDKFLFIGKLTNGAFIAFGMCQSSSASYCAGFDVLLTNNTSCMLRGIVDDFKSSTGNLFKSPLLIEDVSSGTILMNAAEPVTISGVYLASKRIGWQELKGNGYYLSPSGGFTRSVIAQIANSLLFTDISN